MNFDVIIKNGSIVDGDRHSELVRADIGVRNGQIEEIGDLREAAAVRELDARDRVIAPGFIDVHNHSDGTLLRDGHNPSKVAQGFTTEILMADGISYAPVTEKTWSEWFYYLRSLNGLTLSDYKGLESVDDFMNALDGTVTQNVMTHVPYANARSKIAGFGSGPISLGDMEKIQAEIALGMQAGAVGLSTGMDYLTEYYASTDEIVAACKPVAELDGLYVTHVRYSLGTLNGLKEAVEIGERAGVRVHISHLKGSSPKETESLIEYIDSEAIHRVPFTFDVYPYVSSSTMLNSLLPYSVWDKGPMSALATLADPGVRAQFGEALKQLPMDKTFIAWLPGKNNTEHQGKSLKQFVSESSKSAQDALCDLLIEENLAVLLVFRRQEHPDTILPMLSHDRFILGSDGINHTDGFVHPRQYGSAPRLLRFAREQGIGSFSQVIHHMTGFAADTFGISDRGRIQIGKAADIVIFDPEKVSDRATFTDPQAPPIGIETVMVNGTLVSNQDNGLTGTFLTDEKRPGKRLRYSAN